MTSSCNDPIEPKNDTEDQNKPNIELISQWYQSYYLWTSAYMLNTLMNSQNKLTPNQQNIFQPTSPQTSRLNGQETRFNVNVQIQVEAFNSQPRIYKIPSMLKRFTAEFIDAVYIQICKAILAIIVLNYTNIIDENSFNFFDFVEEILTEDNYQNIKFPMELFMLEIIYVSISVAFEAFCLYKKGYTLGKYIMNLKVVTCNSFTERPNYQVIVRPASPLSLKSTLIRTVFKNFSIFILFPTILFFILPAFTESGQTSYDKAANTLVVEGI
ncbi:unnamed protein product [Brachionus calyciflorus]|uniref:RDD domain-containing protein n=1 Tax=Brachionus calyciflorus TaxID=104777 RepID=A0A813S6W0_9BILA|nr:unnamed protein product [Brachionus calyciflorus]